MKSKFDNRLVAFSIVTSFLLIFICSKCSPLYPFNDWVDVHCFLTVGRGIKHGMVPYRDLYEQKGPLLYFIVALATIFSESGFFPLFVIEVAALTVFIYQSMRIVSLWTESKAVYIAAPFVFAMIVASPAFSYGFSAEELCIPFLAWTLRIVLTRMYEKTVLSRNDYFIIGICAAVPFWTKYIFCGYFAGVAVAVALWYVRNGKAIEILRAALWVIAGLLVVTVLILFWYTVKGGLIDMFQAYFINNITVYSDSNNMTGNLVQVLKALFKENILWVVCSLFGITTLALDFRKYQWEFLVIIAGLFMLVFFILLNRFFWTYYTYILSIYAPLVLIPVGIIAGKGRALSQGNTMAVVSIMAMALATGIAYILSPNCYMMGFTKKDFPQYVFAKKMHEEKTKPTLLNYDFLDGGFYYAADIMPVNRFSCKFNIELPEQMEEQDMVVLDGAVDFVVTRDRESIPGDKYELVDSMGLYSYPGYYTYYLFEKKSEN